MSSELRLSHNAKLKHLFICFMALEWTSVVLYGHPTFQLLPEPTSTTVDKNADSPVLVSREVQLLTHELALLIRPPNVKKSG